MGPQERRLTRELAVYLVRHCSLARRQLPPGAILDSADHRRWFERAYREWQLTPRVDLVGRSPYEVIAAERTAALQHPSPPAEPTLELYTDLPAGGGPAADVRRPDPSPPPRPTAPRTDQPPMNQGANTGPGTADRATGWRRLADRLFGPWLDDDLERL